MSNKNNIYFSNFYTFFKSFGSERGLNMTNMVLNAVNMVNMVAKVVNMINMVGKVVNMINMVGKVVDHI